MTKLKPYYATLDRNGTEDEITIHAPDGRPLACIWFWDEDDEAAKPQADRAKADAALIVEALNAHQKRLARRKPKLTEKEKVQVRINANLRKPMPKATVYKEKAA